MANVSIQLPATPGPWPQGSWQGFPAGHGAAVPRESGLHWPGPAPKEMESFWFAKSPGSPLSVSLHLFSLARESPQSPLYLPFIGIYASLLFFSENDSVLRLEKKRKRVEDHASKEVIWYKASIDSCNISVHIGVWKPSFLPLMLSYLGLSLYIISSSHFTYVLLWVKRKPGNGQQIQQRFLLSR